MELLNKGAAEAMAAYPFAAGHGASPGFLGLSLVYYAIPYMMRATTCVCLGSGGGFVPGLMRLAQRDAGVPHATTILVDAVLPEAGFGGPDILGGWLEEDSVFRNQFPDVLVLACLTSEAAGGYLKKNGAQIDYLHVDADHSEDGVARDLRDYLPLMSPYGIITCHDYGTDAVRNGVATGLRELNNVERLTFPGVGAGLAILKLNPT